MSSNFALDIKDMHNHYGLNVHRPSEPQQLPLDHMEMRIDFLQEELNEL